MLIPLPSPVGGPYPHLEMRQVAGPECVAIAPDSITLLDSDWYPQRTQNIYSIWGDRQAPHEVILQKLLQNLLKVFPALSKEQNHMNKMGPPTTLSSLSALPQRGR